MSELHLLVNDTVTSLLNQILVSNTMRTSTFWTTLNATGTDTRPTFKFNMHYLFFSIIFLSLGNQQNKNKSSPNLSYFQIPRV